MIFIVIALVIIILDQLTKYLVRAGLGLQDSIEILGDFLKIVHVENDGAAFGMLGGETRLLVLVPVVFILAMVYLVFRRKDAGKLGMVSKVAVVMIAAGGIGNLIDRLFFGTVTDMISFSIFPPVFNVADIAVTVGAFLLIVSILTQNRSKGGSDE